jgi:hypothetical protein
VNECSKLAFYFFYTEQKEYKLFKQLEQNYVQAQAEITYWKTKYYRMKDRFTALEAKHSKKAPK